MRAWDRARAGAAGAWARVEDARPRHRGLDIAVLAYRRHQLAAGGLLAGALALRAFIWLVPFALVVVAGLGFAAAAHTASPAQVARFGIGGLVAQNVAAVASESLRGRWVTLALGWSPCWRPAWPGPRAYGWPTPSPGGSRPSGCAAAAWPGCCSWPRRPCCWRPAPGRAACAVAPGPGLWVALLVGVVYFAIWLGASWLLPHAPEAPWTAMVPGAVLFAAGTEALHLFTILWLSREIANASRTYGALGVATSLLGGLYLFGWLVVASAMLNASRWERSQHGREERPPAS